MRLFAGFLIMDMFSIMNAKEMLAGMYSDCISNIRGEENHFTKKDIEDAYKKGWHDCEIEQSLHIHGKAELMLKESEEYARKKIGEVIDFSCREYSKMMDDLLKGK